MEEQEKDIEQAIDTPETSGMDVELSPPEDPAENAPGDPAEVAVEDLLAEENAEPVPVEDAPLKAVLEAIVYVAEEPLTLAQLAAVLEQPAARIAALLQELIVEFDKADHGVSIREVAGGL